MPEINYVRELMPTQDPAVRVTNFTEVALGFNPETAIKEAQRCLGCKKAPCSKGCPVEIDIPAFIQLIQKNDFSGAIAKIKEKNTLPAVCGRVCPQESQCEKLCILGKKGEAVGIGRLERFAADFEMKQDQTVVVKSAPSSGRKVAVVGSGPSGLTAAADLCLMGHEVTVFEALHTPGGVLVYGIPEFRLPKDIVGREIAAIEKMGVTIRTNMVIGKIYTLDELLNSGYDAIFVGTGAGLPYFMNIPGENLNGVYSANEFLTRANLMKAYLFPDHLTPIALGEKVAVIGGGNVAMDAARTALRLGAKESYIVYRRTEKEMPARREEVEHAHEEGVQFRFLTSPTEIVGDEAGWMKGMTCLRFELGEPDASGRRSPVPIKGSEYFMPMDTVIMAIGQGPNPLVPETTPDMETNRWGNIIADESTGCTSKTAVFAGGDVVTGAATVILAMGAGKKAARAIDVYLKTLG
ncbi:MAG TPA: NADPH-dependent glutamate synthase [Syntrophomonadaceae bacterium]|nr:NADPH-dependent glutamate synthase [Syntrophomonadaceae bacterium]